MTTPGSHRDNVFRSALETREFVYTAELVLGRDHSAAAAEDFVKEAASCPDGIKVISLTDLPGGHPALPADAFVTRIRALDWNRRLWMTLAADCAQPHNALSPELRAQIISLSMWVGRHTSAVIQQQEPIEPLIEINRIMMQGLGVRATRQTPAAAG